MNKNELYPKYHRMVEEFSLKFERDREIARDLAQDMWVKILASYDTFDPDKGQLSTWIGTVCKSVGMDHAEDRKKEVEFVYDSTLTQPDEYNHDDEAVTGSWLENTIVSPYGDPEEEYALAELQRKLNGLTDDQMEVASRVYFDGQDTKTVAEELNMTVDNVWKICEIVREKLGVKEQTKGINIAGGGRGDWSWKPKGPGNARMGATPCVSRPDLVEKYNNNA